jgi:16S rRNA (uracil1498-N3)-methyltransferase
MPAGQPAARPPADAPLVFAADFGALELEPHDVHHLRRVLRLRDGDPVTIADGHGRWRAARFGPQPQPIDDLVQDEPITAPEITVAFAVVKGERPELVVQKLTELGVDRVVPFHASRSVVRWEPDRAERNVERLRRVAREAAMQCRRARLPEIESVATFAAVVARPGAALADRDGPPPSLLRPFVVVGPEGGWSDEERAATVVRVGLSPHVLRAETAAITACALLTGLRAGVVASTTG